MVSCSALAVQSSAAPLTVTWTVPARCGILANAGGISPAPTVHTSLISSSRARQPAFPRLPRAFRASTPGRVAKYNSSRNVLRSWPMPRGGANEG